MNRCPRTCISAIGLYGLYYSLAGSVGVALGALFGGGLLAVCLSIGGCWILVTIPLLTKNVQLIPHDL